MTDKTTSLVYHCPRHPERAPFCEMTEPDGSKSSPCYECYIRLRNPRLWKLKFGQREIRSVAYPVLKAVPPSSVHV